MTTLTVNIENAKDLPALTDFLNKAGLTYTVDEEYDEALEAALQRGLEDIKAGRVRPLEEVWPEILARYKK